MSHGKVRGVSGFLIVGGGQVVLQVVMRRGGTAGGTFYSAKKWWGNCHPCPPSLTPLIYLKIGPNWPNRQCCLAGSSQMAHRILIFSISMGADYSFYVKTIETLARSFFKVIIFSIGSVRCLHQLK